MDIRPAAIWSVSSIPLILPGVNLNRELDILAQSTAPSRAQQAPGDPNPSHPGPSASVSAPLPPPPPPPRAQDIGPHGVSAAPLLLQQVRLAFEVKTESGLPYNQPSYDQNEYHRPLRKDMYWSETASTRPKEPRYHGQSSGEILLRDAKELKQEFEELSLSAYEETPASNREGDPYSEPWTGAMTYSSSETLGSVPPARAKPPRIRIHRRRSEFWRPTPPEQRALARDVWACDSSSPSRSSSGAHLSEVLLPPPDLLRSLVVLFFVHVNPFTPIFHRQAFEQELARGTHLLQVLQRQGHVDQGGAATDHPEAAGYPDPILDQTRGAGTFARVVLLVCACASRWSGDPRVLFNSTGGGVEGGFSSLSAGYSFFRQVNPWCRTMCAQAGLWDVQIFILSALYLQGCSASDAAWTILGIGIRLSQDIGAHRKKDENTIENELYKRSFCLLTTEALAHFPDALVPDPPLPLTRVSAYGNSPHITKPSTLPKFRFRQIHILHSPIIHLAVVGRAGSFIEVFVTSPISGTLGRPSAMQDIDSDLENPIEVDDEYWPVGGEPDQPPDEPSKVAYFSGLIGLSRVLGRAQQTVVSGAV
ncbi:hypothetical protein FRC10_004124 [Ceratobasidium sp. 414]|nr:hypothetical protein FRC10_004124 [Ceratobasidium sp. 414]